MHVVPHFSHISCDRLLASIDLIIDNFVTVLQIDWVHKITELFDEASVAVNGDLDVEIGSPDYFEALASLLDETSSRTIGKLKKNYSEEH